MSKSPNIDYNSETRKLIAQTSQHASVLSGPGSLNSSITDSCETTREYGDPQHSSSSPTEHITIGKTNSHAAFRTQSIFTEPDIANHPPHSRFGVTEKWFLVIQCAFTGFFSTIGGNIYYPVLTIIEEKFRITEEQVNLTVVVYFILQGISPSIVGGLADAFGRRPVVIVSILIYCAACIGLATCQTYPQIVALRCLQSAGISPVIAINSAIMGDVTTKAERGGYVGYVSGFQVIGVALGALLGALLAARWNWRAIFWFLTIGSGICAVSLIICLPETKRTMVGNGSIRPKNIQNFAPILELPLVQRRLHLNDPDMETLEPKGKTNFFGFLGVLKLYEVDILLLSSGLQFAMWAAQQTGLSLALSKRYHYSVTKIGLCFLPGGICTLISVVVTGRYLNFAYRRSFSRYKVWWREEESRLLAEHNNNQEEVVKLMNGDPRYTFNLCKARLLPALVTMIISSACFCGFGWCIQRHTHIVGILVFSSLGSLFSNCLLTMSTTLLVDLFSSKASTATGCLNLGRCSFSAIYIACLSRMIQRLSYGGVFTLLAGISVLSSIPLYFLIFNGKKICFERKRKEQAILESANKRGDKDPEEALTPEQIEEI